MLGPGPAQFSVEKAPRVKAVGELPQWLACRTWKYKGESYLLAVNGTKCDMAVDLEVEGRYGKAYAELGQMQAFDGGILKLRLHPLGVSFLRLR